MTKFGNIETYSHKGPECPYCGFTLTPDEAIYYDVNKYTEETCPKCSHTFDVEVYHSVSWTCKNPKAPAKETAE